MFYTSFRSLFGAVFDMRLVGRFSGRYGQIDIIERKRDGTRLYVEAGVYQSQATRTGDTPFPYVRLMASILRPAERVLLLGCGGGTLASLLLRAGKQVSIVDRNPLSFHIARSFFGMPGDIPCYESDFRDFLEDTHLRFDGIAIDVSGPLFQMRDAFDAETCELIRARLTPSGRIAMNVMAHNDVDAWPDRLAARLAGTTHVAWLFDHPGREERNVIIACRPETTFHSRRAFAANTIGDEPPWTVRKARLRAQKPI